MKKLFVLVAALALVLAASCDSKNVGPWPPVLAPANITITAPAGMQGGVDANWTVNWTSSSAPFTVVWDFGNGANPNAVTNTAAGNTDATTVQMLNASTTDDANYTVTVTVTDSQARSNSATLNYVVGPTPNLTPEIVSAVYTEPDLVVTVQDADDAQTLTVDVTVPAGMTVDAASKVAAQTGPLTATFTFGAEDSFAGGSGTTTVTVTDQDGATATTDVAVSVAALVLDADTIYAIPMVSTATTADTVTIRVMTGVPANPFQYLVGANVTMPDWCTYAANTFNIGAVGGAMADSDGIWGDMGVTSFLTGPDSFLFGQEKADFGEAGRHRLELNVTPLGGSDSTTNSGALCNFGVEFGQAGTATFGFVEATPPIDRTYYRDGANNDYYWGTLAAGPDGVNTTSVNNEVVVN